MVDWLAGKRVRGTSSERTSLGTTTIGGTGVGGWVELGRTTLESAGDLITVSGLSDKRYYMILENHTNVTSTLNGGWQFNSDTGSNYAQRSSDNGGGDGTLTSITRIPADWGAATEHVFQVNYISNLSSNEKLFQGHMNVATATGAGTAPSRRENTGKWANTSNAISSIRMNNVSGSGDYNTGSEVVVLGWDPADTHTNNFWEELASTELTVAGDDLSSGTITAKKYLWVQAWYKNDGAADINNLTRFNGDAGSNYTSRYSINGAADVTRTSRTWLDIESGGQDAKMLNMFIINNASNEKLVIYHQMDFGAAGAANAPNRREGVGKWANTSNQITEINLKQLDAGDYAAGSILKVWGAD